MSFESADDRALSTLFEDLEQQAEGLALAQRDAEVADRSRDEYAEVDLMSRVHAATGHRVVLSLRGAGDIHGVVARVGADWCLLVRSGHGLGAAEVLIHCPMVVSLRGLPDAAHPVQARSVLSRLAITSCLRRLAEAGGRHTLRLDDGTVRSGELGRVGSDFVEVWGDGPPIVVPLSALACLGSG